MILSYRLFPIVWAAAYQGLARYLSFSSFLAHALAISIAYLLTYLETVPASRKNGNLWPAFQHLRIWKAVADYFPCGITLHKPLDHKQQYIFCNFPHGACSVNHVLTMTNSCSMLSVHYKGPRRDLAASILHLIPLIKDFLLFLGCVDASAATARYNLNKGRSILIYIGGEKEQLMTVSGEQKIYLLNRKGFVKLALQYGAHLVPMYAFGENEVYTSSSAFIGARKWLQANFSIGLPIFWGRWGSLLPHRVPIHLEIGEPIPVQAKSSSEISDKDIDELHSKFTKAMETLFEKSKVKYPAYRHAKLQIL